MSNSYHIDLYIEPHDKDGTFYIGQKVKGEFTLVPNQDLEIQYFDYRLQTELRGKLVEEEKTQLRGRLLGKTRLIQGETYRYPFEFIYEGPPSYRGKNGSLVQSFEYAILLANDPEPNQNWNPFKAFKDKKRRAFEHILMFQWQSSELKVEEQNIKLKQRLGISLNYVRIVVFLLFALPFFLETGYEVNINFMYLYIPGMAFAVGAAIHFLIGYFVLGTFRAIFSQSDPYQFTVDILHQNDWRGITKVKAEVYGIEQVLDQRNTKHAHLIHDVYKSPEQDQKNLQEDASFRFDLPRYGPASLKMSDLEINYFFKVRIYTFLGIRYSYHHEFLINYFENLEQKEGHV